MRKGPTKKGRMRKQGGGAELPGAPREVATAALLPNGAASRCCRGRWQLERAPSGGEGGRGRSNRSSAPRTAPARAAPAAPQ
jgi:hypothetical protein